MTINHESFANIALLLDYDNLHPNQKSQGIRDIVNKVLLQVSAEELDDRVRCEVRLYGGWYEGTNITRLAEDLSVQIQRDFPFALTVSRTGGAKVSISITAELASALLEEPAHQIFNTYRQKGRPANVRVRQSSEIGCTNGACVLDTVRKVVAKGKCPIEDCAVEAENLVYRNEQKIVDAMLTCDLLFVAGKNEMTILVSSDDDFLPPLRVALLRGARIYRFHPQRNVNRASFPAYARRLVELDL